MGEGHWDVGVEGPRRVGDLGRMDQFVHQDLPEAIRSHGGIDHNVVAV